MHLGLIGLVAVLNTSGVLLITPGYLQTEWRKEMDS